MNDQDKIAELTAEIDRLRQVLSERQAKIGQLMGEAARAGIAGGPASVPGDRNAVLPHVMPQAIQTDGESDESFYRRVVYNNGWNACRDFMFAGAAAPAAPLPEQPGPSVEDDPEFDDLIGKLAKTNTSSEWDEGKACREWRDELVAYIDSRSAASPSPAPAQQQEPRIFGIDYSGDYLAEVRNKALDLAAAICDGVNNHDNPMTAGDCADAIRALKSIESVETAAPGASIGDKQ